MIKTVYHSFLLRVTARLNDREVCSETVNLLFFVCVHLQLVEIYLVD